MCCNNCLHIAVCGKYLATGGHVRNCKHFYEVGDKWVPTAERLPERFQPVIICRNGGKVETGWRDVNDWWRVYGTRVKTVTHWMPIPEPPKEK